MCAKQCAGGRGVGGRVVKVANVFSASKPVQVARHSLHQCIPLRNNCFACVSRLVYIGCGRPGLPWAVDPWLSTVHHSAS